MTKFELAAFKWLKKRHHLLSFTPYENESELKEIEDIINMCQQEIKIVPMGDITREPAISEMI